MLFGKLFKEQIDKILEQPLIIAIIMLAGGVVLLFVDNWFKRPVIKDENQISTITAFKIGLYQCLSIIFPGLSRSAATIIGGMSFRLSRSAAAEFSFFLAVPTMLAATVYTIYKYAKENGSFTTEQIKLLAIGNAVAFIVALIAIKFFITLLKRYGFRMWGFYRIIVGLALIILIYSGFLKS